MAKKETSIRPSVEDVRAVTKFIRRLERYVGSEELRQRRGYAADWVLPALVSKSVWVAKAVCSLVRSGYPEEAFGLTRTLTDIFFTVRYICNKDSDRRARQYANYFAKEQEMWLRVKNLYFPKKRLRPRSDQAKLTVLAKQFKDPHRWSGHDTRYIAQEPDTIEKDAAGNPATLQFDYEVIYAWTSRFVHPTVAALDSHVGAVDIPFRIAPVERETMGEGNTALFNTVLFLTKVFIYVFRTLGTGLPDRIGEESKSTLQLLIASGERHRRKRRRKRTEEQ